MRVFRDERTRETLFGVDDREVAYLETNLVQTVGNEIVEHFKREGIRRLTRPRAIPVKSSTCWIPRHKLRKS